MRIYIKLIDLFQANKVDLKIREFVHANYIKWNKNKINQNLQGLSRVNGW